MLKALFVGLVFAVLALAERVAPSAQRAEKADARRLFRNLALWALNTAMNPIITVPIAALAVSLDVWTRPQIGFWPSLTLDFLVLDLWTYCWHRANHLLPVLWRFHRVHHFDEFLDTTSAVRFHPGEVLISALARAPLIIVADIDLTSLVVFDALALAAALFHHSNVRLPAEVESGLRWFVVTPSHHWVHHHAIRVDTNSNYGLLLTIWDRFFRSWSPMARSPAMSIGVEGETDRSWLRLLLSPFRRS